MKILVLKCNTGEGRNSVAAAIQSLRGKTATYATSRTRCRFFLSGHRNLSAHGMCGSTAMPEILVRLSSGGGAPLGLRPILPGV